MDAVARTDIFRPDVACLKKVLVWQEACCQCMAVQCRGIQTCSGAESQGLPSLVWAGADLRAAANALLCIVLLQEGDPAEATRRTHVVCHGAVL